MENDEIQRADPKTRHRAFIYLTIAAVLCLVAIGMVEEWLHRLAESAAHDPHAASDQAASTLTVLGGLISASLVGISLIAARLSWRIVQTDRFPPPGTHLTVDVRVLHGSAARSRAYVGFVVAALLAAMAVLLPYFLWRALYTLAPGYA